MQLKSILKYFIPSCVPSFLQITSFLNLFVQELKLNQGFDVYDLYCDNFIVSDMPCS